MRYILNSCVITAPGNYNYRHINLEEARRWINAGPFRSTIRYQETARALAVLLKKPIEIRSEVTHLEVGEEALVFRLAFPPGARRLPVSQKGRISTSFVLDHCEIGILERLPDGAAVPLEEYNELAERLRACIYRAKSAGNAAIKAKHALWDRQTDLALDLLKSVEMELEFSREQ